MTPRIEKILKNLPHKPGVYLHKHNGVVIYVGKAKDLYKRVRNYFYQTDKLDAAKQIMVTKIDDIEIITVNSENEALILEDNFIKKFRPQYNISLKDDKEYKFIKIDYTLDFPKIYTVRKIEDDGSKYFGPFTNGWAVNETLKLLRTIFPYRTCHYELNLKPGEDRKKFIDRPCLYYYIKRCDAPCVALQSRAQYMKNIHAAEHFLSGDTKTVLKEVTERMREASAAQKYEDAAKYRDQIQHIEHIIARQKIVSPRLTFYDVIDAVKDGNEAFVNLFLIRDGKLMGRENFTVEYEPGTSKKEILTSFVKQFYQRALNFPKEILVPEELTEQPAIAELITKRAAKMGMKHKVRITVPTQGDKKKLLKLSEENASEYKKKELLFGVDKPEHIDAALRKIAEVAGLKEKPHRIEIYDMSNIQGTNAVGSMVVFTNGKADKAMYRRFQIQTFTTPNDVGMMTEVLIRRLSRIKNKEEMDKWPKPDLIILDGGKPQQKAMREAMKATGVVIPYIGLAKREEEIVIPGQEKFVRFPRGSKELFLMQRMRDEAHRFAITYHRNLRDRKMQHSVLDDIVGLGPKTKKKLYQTFGSVHSIADAPLNKLEEVAGKKLAKKIKEQLS
jgi:excinuclease ABC subunit C